MRTVIMRGAAVSSTTARSRVLVYCGQDLERKFLFMASITGKKSNLAAFRFPSIPPDIFWDRPRYALNGTEKSGSSPAIINEKRIPPVNHLSQCHVMFLLPKPHLVRQVIDGIATRTWDERFSIGGRKIRLAAATAFFLPTRL